MTPRYVKRQLFIAEEGAPSVPQGDTDEYSLDFDGSTEYIANKTAQNIGLGAGGIFSVAGWIYPHTLPGDSRTMFGFRHPDGRNNGSEINIMFHGGATEYQFLLGLPDGGGGHDKKSYRFLESRMPEDAWGHYVATWDGTNWVIYLNGSQVDPDTIVDDDTGFTFVDDNCYTMVGGFVSDDFGDGFRYFDGLIHSTAFWSKVLSEDTITDIYNGGDGAPVDLREVQGNYSQDDVDNLQHYWRHGFNSGDIGEDLGNGTAIDLGNNSANITSADIVNNYPGE